MKAVTGLNNPSVLFQDAGQVAVSGHRIPDNLRGETLSFAPSFISVLQSSECHQSTERACKESTSTCRQNWDDWAKLRAGNRFDPKLSQMCWYWSCWTPSGDSVGGRPRTGEVVEQSLEELNLLMALIRLWGLQERSPSLVVLPWNLAL